MITSQLKFREFAQDTLKSIFLPIQKELKSDYEQLHKKQKALTGHDGFIIYGEKLLKNDDYRYCQELHPTLLDEYLTIKEREEQLWKDREFSLFYIMNVANHVTSENELKEFIPIKLIADKLVYTNQRACAVALDKEKFTQILNYYTILGAL